MEPRRTLQRSALLRAVSIALVATTILGACSGDESGQPATTTPATEVATDAPPIQFDDAPVVGGRVDVGSPLVGAEVRLLAADGADLAAPVTTDEVGLYGFEIATVPDGAKVVAAGGTLDGAAFDGHLAAPVERFEDGSPAPTYVTVPTTIEAAVLDQGEGIEEEDAEIMTRQALGIDDENASLGLDVAIDDVSYPQAELLEEAAARGGLDAFVFETADRTLQSTTPLPPALEFGPNVPFGPGIPVFGPVIPGPVVPTPVVPTPVAPGPGTVPGAGGAITAASIQTALGNMVLSSVGTFVMQQAGFDATYNMLLEIRAQLQALTQQLTVMQQQIGSLAHSLNQESFLSAIRNLQTAHVDRVKSGMVALDSLAAERAKVAQISAAGGDAKAAEDDLDVATQMFEDVCSQHSADYRSIPGAITDNFRGPDSILERYLNVVLRPRRYITAADTEAFAAFFQTYRGYQVSALRLYAECYLLKDPSAAESIIRLVFVNPESIMQRARFLQLPAVMPQPLPAGVVLDLTTNLVWLDDSDVGSHPAQIVVPSPRIPATRTFAGPNGSWTFDLAPAADIRGFAQLNAPRTPAQLNQLGQAPRSDRFPAQLQPFLADVGLPTLASKIRSSSIPAFVWSGDTGSSAIKRCHSTNGVSCSRLYGEDLGRTGLALMNADLDQVYMPQTCAPRVGCNFLTRYHGGGVTVCGPTGTYDRCITDEQFRTIWSGPGMYRARLLDQDRFSTIDLARLDS